MKKALSLVLAVVLMLSMATVASAENTTTLTTTVPAATYTLNIPADQEIEYGANSPKIGSVTVTNATGFAKGKNLKVAVTYDSFKSDGISTTIPFELSFSGTYNSGGSYGEADDLILTNGGTLTFFGLEDTTVNKFPRSGGAEYTGMYINIDSEDWGKALGGDYSATITFTAEVVVAE